MRRATPKTPWLHTLRADARLRLLCLPFAGGGAAAFASWARQLPADVELCPVLLPGREVRMSERPYQDMAALVAALVEGLQEALDRPYSLLGYSLGATVAYELVRALRRRGHPPPRRLFVISRHAPRFLEAAPIAELPRDAFLAALQERYNAIPPQVLAERALMDLFVPTLRADFALLERYRHEPGSPIEAPISAWFGRRDVTLTRARVAAWSEVTGADFELIEHDASHFFHQDPRLIRAVADRLR